MTQIMELTPKNIRSFRKFIFEWWRNNRRDLPWRHTHDAYAILVSEVMLQQTQVSRVLPKYRELLARFPDVFALARATNAEVLRMWKGMGYNRRALYLKKTAEIVCERYKGIFPNDESLLIKLPGLGKYTARAILVFGYKQNVAAVDTNIRQIIIHHFFKGEGQKESVVESVAGQLVPAGKSWEWHQALMDYGALELQKLKGHGKSRKPPLPFRESNRFFRGRIMDELRVKDRNELDLIEEFVRRFDRSEEFLRSILTGLAKDGLVTRKKGMVFLPE